MTRTYFGTDGIRGTVGVGPITPEFMLRLGHAAGQVLLEQHGSRDGSRDKRATVLIGKDTRVSGYMIESALEAGFASAGVDVLLTGPLPTPGVAYLTQALRLHLGVVISGFAQPFRTTTASSSSRRRARSCQMPGSSRSKRGWPSRRAASIRHGSARRAGSTTRAVATSSFARAPSPAIRRCAG